MDKGKRMRVFVISCSRCGSFFSTTADYGEAVSCSMCGGTQIIGASNIKGSVIVDECSIPYNGCFRIME